MKRQLKVKCALVLALVAGLLPPGVSHAGSNCILSARLGTYQVRKWVIPGLSSLGTFSSEVTGEHEVPAVDPPSYNEGMAAFVYNPSTGAIPTYVIDYGGGYPSHVVIESNGVKVDQAIPAANDGDQGGYHKIVAGKLTAGTYWIIAFGFGQSGGILYPTPVGTWSVTMNYGGVACGSALNIPDAQIANYNNSHFSGGIHVYAAGAELGRDTAISFDVAQKSVFGLVYNDMASTVASGNYTLPNGVTYGMSPGLFRLISTNGHYVFSQTLRAGVDTSFDIDFLKLTLPNINSV